jgi:hypothetical protein
MVFHRAYAIVWGAFVVAACSSRVSTGDSAGLEPDQNEGGKSLGRRASGSRPGSGGAAPAADDDSASSGGSQSSVQSTIVQNGVGGAQGSGNTGASGSFGSSDGGSGRAKDGGLVTSRGGSKNVDGGSKATSVGGSVAQAECTDIQTSDHQGEPCSIWVDWGHCDADWLQGYCNKTCGRCNSTVGSTTVSTPTKGTGSSTSSVTVTPLGNDAQTGWASRYWDCCKPHCAWPGRAPKGTMKMCSQQNQPLSDQSAGSSCDNGPAYTCWDMAPWAVSDKLAYGYAATPAGGNDCGKCYQLDFIGSGQHNANDPGSKAIAGQTMIVQATNIGGDVGSGQFDIMVPGGGVGAFNGCSRQWGTSSLGAQYGGFVNECDTGGSLDPLKNCVTNKCQSVFGKSGMDDLLAGCLFYVKWFQTANNPKLRYKQVTCPAELTSRSGMSG